MPAKDGAGGALPASGPASASGPQSASGGGGRREAALAAFARHPLVDSEELAARLLAGYEAAFPDLAALWAAGS